MEKNLKKTMKTPVVPVLIALAFTTVSCIKKAPDAVIKPENIQSEEILKTEEVISEQKEILVEAKVLSPKSHFCLLGRDKKMHEILSVAYGNNLSVIHEEDEMITMESEGTLYAKAVYKEVEYWISTDTIALQCETALVLERSILYADPEFMLTTDDINSPFRFGDFLCRSIAAEDENDFFDRIYYYDRNSKKVKSAYIKKGLISTRTDDIVVMDCVKQLRITKRATPRNEIFKRAAKYKPCLKVAAALDAEKTEKIENNYQDVLNALPGAKYKVNVPELLTVDQSKDPFQ